ncbi:23S rRNA (guanosine(2251)-2'-O)-methyltransferase RlmB [Planomonospora parontospora subsp. parontospora]|uniref:23S rRNA (Guanosine(2251)-2'-O)-methyltransferase RlmB n=2 Tax=Planomonospora parontospora TaxID=58119 RepID=A0AA37BDK5_9ACTN|nr:23S rRNA (guanosine(2251)-2'-O)-methyltransferase RlmB [Planomonospora parontospora]GGK54312.1 23S rRNA (guanosine(2251)-2'-O)-methyltransferase RlmB [Planomonospora parontospora]GII07528.1 23S rRNA (guanosine(2251)-2'-O)-methyltransferase RlmB [Planomonospora parontospora subsp. parontospora]
MAGGGRGSGRPAKKKSPTKGTGGNVRRGLEGRGATPPAHMRHWYKDKARTERLEREEKTGRSSSQRPAPARTRRSEDAPEYIGGRNPVLEALRAGVPASALYIAQRIDNDDRVKESVRIAADRGIPMLEAGREKLDRLTEGGVHQGVALQIPAYEYAHPEDLVHAAQDAAEVPLIVALDSVTDPRNLGAIARSATAFGAHGLVVPSRRSAGVTAGAWKTSAGTLANMTVARAANLTATLRDYREAGLFVIGLDGEGTVDVGDANLLDGPLVVVVGSEGKGLSRLVREACDLVVRIPMSAAAESLNAGVAAGIALYEVARHRKR